MFKECSQTMLSNIFTKMVSSTKDPRQNVGRVPYSIPDFATREFLAKLILEEALETVAALGFHLGYHSIPTLIPHHPQPSTQNHLATIIDGCCDTIYVSTGCLAACGAPDLPHLREVNKCNDAKFPDGRVIVNADGKYLKPEGWKSPDHITVSGTMQYTSIENLWNIGLELVHQGSSPQDVPSSWDDDREDE